MNNIHIKPLLALLITTLLSCQGFSQLAPADFDAATTGKPVQVLDVRSFDNFKAGHIPHAMQADWGNQTQFTSQAQYLDKDKPVYVYCADGAATKAAAGWLRSNGFGSVFELTGGFAKWKEAGKATEVLDAKAMTAADVTAATSGSGITLVSVGGENPGGRKTDAVLQWLARDMSGKYKLVKIEGGISADLMTQLKATIPTLILYQNGKEVWRKQGAVELEELEKEVSR